MFVLQAVTITRWFFIPYGSFVGDDCTLLALQPNEFGFFEACRLYPFSILTKGKVESSLRLQQHGQTHQHSIRLGPSLFIDDALDCH